MAATSMEAALHTVLDPQASSRDKALAHQALTAFKASDGGLQWAIQLLDAPQPAPDQLLWLASDTVAFWARYRALSGSAGLEVLRQRLWAWLASGTLPHFAASKLAAALGCLACQAWPAAYPDFWADLQHCLEERQAVGLRVLAAALEEFHSNSQATSAGFRGRVLSSQLPGIQARFAELQPAAVSLLCSLLRQGQASLASLAHHGQQQGQGGGASARLSAELVAVLEALRTLRKALSDLPAASSSPHQHQQQQQEGGTLALLELLFGLAQSMDLPLGTAGASSGALAGSREVAAAAMDCISDLLARPRPQQEGRQVLELAVARLPACLTSVQRHQGSAGGAAEAPAPEDDPAFAACARLLAQFASRQLGRAEGSPQLQQGALALLAQVTGAMFARRAPADVIAFGEVWHAVLDHRDALELERWGDDDGDDVGGQQQQPQGSRADVYKAPTLQAAHLVLATLYSPAGKPALPGAQAPPFSASLLDGSEGSGAPLEDWVQAVSAAGGGEEGAEEAAGAEGEGEGDEEEERLAPGQGGSGPASSEQEVYTRLGEAFVGRVATTYSAPMLPLLLRCFAQHSATLAQGCQHIAALAQQQGQQAQLAAAAPALQAAAGDLDVSLRLLGRCGASLPLRGLGEQVILADLGVPAGPGEGAPLVTGAHASAAYTLLLDLAGGWQQTVQTVLQGGPGASAALLPALAPVGAQIYRALSALTATWLSRLMLTQLSGSTLAGDDAVAALASRLVQGALAAPAQLLCGLGAGTRELAGSGRPLTTAAVAAAEALVPLTSIALSSSMRPSPQLLGALLVSPAYQALQQLVAQALPGGPLPTRVLRALWISLSDLSLRSWGALPAAGFPAAERGAHFAAAVAAPLVQCLSEAAHNMGAGASAPGAELAVRRAAAVARHLIFSYAGTPKHIRAILYSSLAAPLLPPALALLRHCAVAHQGLGGRAGAPLLRLLGSVIDLLALELRPQGLEQLLGALVEVFGSGGGDPSMESDLVLMQLLCGVMGQGGNKHAALLLPSLHFCAGVWQRAGQCHRRDVDVGHVKAVALASLLSLLRQRWRQISGAHVLPLPHEPAPAAPGAGAGPLVQLHQQLAQQASAAAQGAAGAAGCGGQGADAVGQVLGLLREFLAAAAAGAGAGGPAQGTGAGRVVLAAADVRLVLEELYELQVVARLYQGPHFQPVCASVAASLLCMLLSRCYTAAQNDLVDTLFSLAAANWSEFHLSFLPAFAAHRLAGLGGSERGALLALFGASDLDAPTFERQALAFMNDVLFYEQALGVHLQG